MIPKHKPPYSKSYPKLLNQVSSQIISTSKHCLTIMNDIIVSMIRMNSNNKFKCQWERQI